MTARAKVYIVAGPDPDRLHEAAATLRERGHVVLNPRLGLAETAEEIFDEVRAIARADEVALLPGACDSSRGRAKIALARLYSVPLTGY